MKSRATKPLTGSQESGVGHTPSTLPVGTQLDLFGARVSLVNPSPAPAKGLAKKTKDTSGRHSLPSSASAALTRSLANNLLARLESVGSMEYELTLKVRVTPSGLRLLRQRARARRTSASASTGSPPLAGWPTARQHDGDGGLRSPEGCQKEFERRGEGADLPTLANLAGWPTAQARDGDGRGATAERATGERMNLDDYVQLAGWQTPSAVDGLGGHLTRGGARSDEPLLPGQAKLAGWATPTVGDASGARNETASRQPGSQYNSGQTLIDQTRAYAGWATPSATDHKGSTATGQRRGQLSEQTEQGLDSGTTSTSSPVETANTGVLNAAFSLWLQGFPGVWLTALPATDRERKRFAE